MNITQLTDTANALVAPGKGILAADESNSTIKKRFDIIKLEATPENRHAFRQMLFTTAGANEFISGVILYDETTCQQATNGNPFPQLLAAQGLIPGVKADIGYEALAGCPGEQITRGLDDLRTRLTAYRALGIRFAKWRAIINIGAGLPSRASLQANAHALARYAAICQELEIVPVVEPEVLMEGDHSLESCAEVTAATLRAVYEQLHEQKVLLEGTLLKPNMIMPGKLYSQRATPEQIAEATIQCFRRAVPAAVPGIVFLSGGQTPVEATVNLNAMNALGSWPWQLSFSYGRALQEPPLRAWQGKADLMTAGQQAYLHRARCNSAARFGHYSAAME